ncbi:MAG TPA: PIN domain-containing protein [Thermoanaerobaculia bacterium]
MTEAVLVDTGPIVAFLNSRDRYHEWSKETFAGIEAPVLSCEAVLSEACFLLRNARGGGEAVLKLLDRGLVRLPFHLEAETGPIGRLLSRYSNVPMSLADACLVRMSEQISDSVLLTLDRDFKVYRKHGRNVIPTRMPDGL